MQIYLIVGESGEYSDTTNWYVKAFIDKRKAQRWLKNCEKDAKKWEEDRKNDYISPEHGWSKYDPEMYMSYTGAQYNIVEVDLIQ